MPILMLPWLISRPRTLREEDIWSHENEKTNIFDRK